MLSAGTSYESVRLFFELIRLFGFISPLGPSWSKPSETCQTVSWSCQTMGCGRPRLSFSTGPKLPELTLQTLRNLPNRRLELPAVAGQVFPFFPGPQLPDAPFKPSKPSETCQTVSWSCQTMDTSCRSRNSMTIHDFRCLSAVYL